MGSAAEFAHAEVEMERHELPLLELCATAESPEALHAALKKRWPLTLREYIRRDLARNRPGSWKRTMAIVAFRLKWYPAHYTNSRVLTALGKLFSRVMTYVLIQEIPVAGGFVGPGLCLTHAWSNTLFHNRAILGENVTLFQDVMIGESKGPPQFGDLVLGDGVICLRGAGIFGECRIGDGAIIGAHALIVNQDVEAGAVMAAPRPVRLR